MKSLLIVGFLLDEFTDKPDNPPVEKRGVAMMKEVFVCLITEKDDGLFEGYAVDVGDHIFYNLSSVELFTATDIRFHAVATKLVKVDLPLMTSDEPGNIQFSETQSEDVSLEQSIELHLQVSEKGLFWKGLRWSMVSGYMKQQFSAFVGNVPQGFFDIRPEDTQKASMAKAFQFMESMGLFDREPRASKDLPSPDETSGQ